MFLSCSPVSGFVTPDPLQLSSVLIYSLQQFEKRQRNLNDRGKTAKLFFMFDIEKKIFLRKHYSCM